MIDNLSLYKIFVEVARSGSISGAAKRLYVTQPAVSNGVAQLESALGTMLFFRTSRGINLYTRRGTFIWVYQLGFYEYRSRRRQAARNKRA
ncbi:MAG: LysR family transcriptional regulator [Clostridiales bacterium]|nr:LysR family transcriptional regulator [Clostridiales bacterium]